MTILKNSVKSQILNQLNNMSFCREDFEVQFHDSGNTFVTINFVSRPEYNLKIYESSGAIQLALMGQNQDSEDKVYCRMAPGEYKNLESQSHISINSAITSICQWLDYIEEDLVNLKSAESFNVDDFTKSFQESINESVDNPEEYFTKQEAQELRDKLDALQGRVSELETQFKLTSEDTQKFEKTISRTKSDLDVFPKGIWYKTAGNKIINTVKEIFKTKEGREALLGAAKKLLGSD